MEKDHEVLFEKLMAYVGRDGWFQTRFNYVFNTLFVATLAMPYLNIILALTVPEHWCHVPGREHANMSLEEWKLLTIPREEDDKNKMFRKCHMYNWTEPPTRNATKPDVVGCQYGWEYDRTWYTRTVVTQENWVCEKELYVANTFAVSRFGDVLGSFIFGQLGDIIGRRPVFFITLVMLAVGRCLCVVTANNYTLFLITILVGSLSQSTGFQSPMVIGIEMSAPDRRAHLAMLQCLGWTAGICIMPLIAWGTGDWVYFFIFTSVPCVLFCIFYRWFPESARWLAAKGRIKKCEQELRKIAKINKTSLPEDSTDILTRIAQHKEKVYGVASLFSNWRLAKNSVLIVYLWVVNSVAYFTLLLSVSNISGNPFMNFFWQSLAELPGYIAGKFLSDRYGRRWTQSGAYMAMAAASFAVTFFILDQDLSFITTCLIVIVRLGTIVTYYVIHLVGMETYPTCVRQSGTSLGSIIGSGTGILGPYIVYLGTTLDMRYPYLIMGLLFVTGTLGSLFLPETLYQRLPETLADAHKFGKHQAFWSLPKKPLLERLEMCEIPLKNDSYQETCS